MINFFSDFFGHFITRNDTDNFRQKDIFVLLTSFIYILPFLFIINSKLVKYKVNRKELDQYV